MEPIVEFLIWMHENPEIIAEITLKLMEQYHWTPRQVAEEVTVMQLLELWDYSDENKADGDQFIRERVRERLKCQQPQQQEPPPLRWRHIPKPSKP